MAWDPIWEEIFLSREWGKYPSEQLIRFIAKSFYQVPREKRKEFKVLEIGCGPGANLWYCAREGLSVYGVDGAQSAIKQAELRLNEELPDWKGMFSTGDISSLNYPTNYFDAVIDNEAVCCNSLESSKAIYREAARVTKVGGAIYVRTFADGSYGDGSGKKFEENAYLCSEGPSAGKGYTRFTKAEQIPELLGPDFKLSSIELLSMTCNDRKDVIKEWIIYGEKK
jgi:ubiquinone/menaquinone biosynthesis C-methylase UbiE